MAESRNLVKWKERAPWVILPVSVFLAFAVGTRYGSDIPTETSGHAHEEQATTWTCSMHPQIRQPEPGLCPICGMDLIAVTDSASDDGDATVVKLSRRARVKARIRTNAVQRLENAVVERHLLGRVDYDETALRTVTAWVGGRIDRLTVRTTGERVRRGQVIATLYSPEVYSAHQDLIQANQQLARLDSKASAGARTAAEAALRAARDRLRLLGVPEDELSGMETAERPSEQVAIRTPFSGTVIERIATAGAYVRTGSGLYKVADLSRVWVQLDAYESDLPLLQVGQEVSLKIEALPEKAFSGRVTFVDPILNPRTRTARVRIEVMNSDRRLSPGMFAEAVVKSNPAHAADQPLVIPDSAPLFTGRRSVVYVERQLGDQTAYEARIVRLGAKRGRYYPVVAGLSEGERVVTHGAFALDADLQIRGGLSMMMAPDDTQEGPYENIVSVPAAHEKALAKIVEHYLALHSALASDALQEAKTATAKLEKATDSLKPHEKGAFREAWLPIARQLSVHAGRLRHATDLAQARIPFRDVSQQIATVLRVFGNPVDDTVHLAFCPMALGNQGAEWVQRSETIENPYFGASMHRCGEVHSAVMHGTYLPAKRGSPTRAPAAAGGHQH